MTYKYREVICPWCKHRFMWTPDAREGLLLHKYKLKATGEFVEETKCPSCNEEMVVLEHLLEGVFTDDPRIERVRERV